MRSIADAFHRLTLGAPWLVTLLLLAVLGAAAWQAQYFKLDASADSLILEGDEDLAYFREIAAEFGTQDFLVVTYRPQDERGLFEDATLAHLKQLRDELAGLEFVDSVLSMLDVPLIQSPPVWSQKFFIWADITPKRVGTPRMIASYSFRSSTTAIGASWSSL